MPPDPSSPSTARPLLGDSGAGDGVGVAVMRGVSSGSSVRTTDAVTLGVGVAVGRDVTVGRGVGSGVGRGVGRGVGVGQKGGMQGSSVGDGVIVGDAVGQSTPLMHGGVCAEAEPVHANPSHPPKRRAHTQERLIYISTTRCVSVERTPGRPWICSRTTSAR